ncbi:Pentatricopeptide repeat-containing protein [Artemisia annua]|uniref:Pentatricopeptide repeat-containing protein n=1 Tax=Artemisia annua TaxID=35608 RepID=A0A2U1QAV4_ARTAN|nr:Pentatricopeptide repeat-containing protein [Artemisia annua]
MQGKKSNNYIPGTFDTSAVCNVGEAAEAAKLEGERRQERPTVANTSEATRWTEKRDSLLVLGEYGIVDKIVQDVSTNIQPRYRESNLIGMQSHMDALNSLLDIEATEEVRIVGIYGMGGIGTTTIAQALFRRISSKFEGSSFIRDIRENSSTKTDICVLKEKILGDILGDISYMSKIQDPESGANMIQERFVKKKFLLVLDDVDDVRKLEFLAATHDWFGTGSRIIITTRDMHLLSDTDAKYKPDLLCMDQAAELFSRHAFRANMPPDGYKEISERAIRYTGRLPLALKVLGSFFRGRQACVWESALDRLAKLPNNEVYKTLKLSFDDLNDFEQNIFLDIACFFTGREVKHVTRILDSFCFHPAIGISVLIEKSLMTIHNRRIRMHDLIQEMGKHICGNAPYSRLWDMDVIHDLVKKNRELQVIEGIVVHQDHKHALNVNVFESMNNLRLLDVHGEFTCGEPTFLPYELRWLCWKKYPFLSLPVADMHKLVGLEMKYGKIERLWKGHKKHATEPVWHLDSGCSRSMTGVKQYLHKYIEEPGPKEVFGDNSSAPTEGYGSAFHRTPGAHFSTFKPSHFHTFFEPVNFNQLANSTNESTNSSVTKLVKFLRSGISLEGVESDDFLDGSGVKPSEDLISLVIWELRDEWKLAFLVFKWGRKWRCCDEKSWRLMVWVLGNHKKFSNAWCLIKDLYRESSMDTQLPMFILIDSPHALPKEQYLEGDIEHMLKRVSTLNELGSLMGESEAHNQYATPLGYAAANEPAEAIRAFQLMERFKLSPDQKALYTLLDTLCKHGNVEEAEEFMFLNAKLFPLETEGFNIILSGWCNVYTDIIEAKRIWKEMDKCRVIPDEDSYTHMISCFSKVNNLFESLRLYDEMKRKGWKPNIRVYNSLVYVLAHENCHEEAVRMLDKMKEMGLIPNSSTYNFLISPLCKAGKLEDARSMLSKMLDENLNPNIDTFHAFLEGKGVSFETSLELLERMMKSGNGPNSDTFLILLGKFMQSNEAEIALKIWVKMKEYRVSPDSAHFMIMVEGLVKHGLTFKAKELRDEMLSIGIKEDPKLTKLFKDMSLEDEVKEIKKQRHVKCESRGAGLHHGKKWFRGKRSKT